MTNLPSLPDTVSAGLIKAERIDSLLHDRTIGLADAAEWPFWRAVNVERGRIAIILPGSETVLEGPCFAWIPWSSETRLRIFAGTVGTHVSVGNTLLNNAIGHKPESSDLRSLVRLQTCVSLADDQTSVKTITQCFEGILREAKPAAFSATVIEALMRIILIELWRAEGAPGSYGAAANPSQRLMNRFNNLVEMRFREHWTVQTYARAIGISADRLNDICRRFTGKTPKRLIMERMGLEARLLLVNSTNSVEHIAGLLGFPSAAQFNRFFKTIHGQPPGTYRQQVLARTPDGSGDRRANMHEWP